jgi:tetratricopeptide (TPR) repeat protein
MGYQQINDSPGIARTWANLGAVYRQYNNLSAALVYYRKAARLCKAIGGHYYFRLFGQHQVAVGDLYRLQGFQAEKLKKTQAAKTYYRQAIEELREGLGYSTNGRDWLTMHQSSYLLSKTYERVDDYKTALHFFTQAVSYRDSAVNLEKEKERNQHELRLQYNDSLSYFKKLQEKQVYILEQDNKLKDYRVNQLWLFSVIIIIAIALVGSFFIYRYRLQKLQAESELQREKFETRLKGAEFQRRLNDMTLAALHSQMNPHFIFNALNTIQSFIFSENKRAATSYLGKFSELIRKILDYSQNPTITLMEEFAFVRLYIEIEKERFDNQLLVTFDIDEELSLEEIEVPSMFIQPYVENALKHGLLHKTGLKTLSLSLNFLPGPRQVQVRIEDNGIGRMKSAEINKKRINHHPFASQANGQRAKLISELWGKQIQVVISDKVSNEGLAQGTIVIITFPCDIMHSFQLVKQQELKYV